MPTPVVFTVDDLDADLKLLNPEYANMADFVERRTRAVKRAYSEMLTIRPWGVGTTLTEGVAPSTGTAIMDTSIGDVFVVALIDDAKQVDGDVIWIKQGTGTFEEVPRKTRAEIIIGGTDETELAFYETNGNIVIYSKQAEFTAPADVHYDYIRKRDADLDPTTNELDIDIEEYEAFLASVNSFMS